MEKRYIGYTVQKRKYSSNVVMGVYKTPDGKQNEEIILIPTLPKAEGDKLCLVVINSLLMQVGAFDFNL